MGPGIVIIFWMIIAAIFGGIWLFCLVLYILGRRYRKPIIKWMGLIPLATMTILAVTVGSLIAYRIIRSSIPRYVYADTFHEKPTSDVFQIKSEVFGFADSSHTFIQFKASQGTFEKICPDRLKPMTYSEYKDKLPMTNLENPRWWIETPANGTQIRMFHTKWGEGRQFAAETEYMTFDASSQTVQYFYHGID